MKKNEVRKLHLRDYKGGDFFMIKFAKSRGVKIQNSSDHLLLFVATGPILRVRNVLLQYVPETLHQLLLIDLHFLDFYLSVLQHTGQTYT